VVEKHALCIDGLEEPVLVEHQNYSEAHIDDLEFINTFLGNDHTKSVLLPKSNSARTRPNARRCSTRLRSTQTCRGMLIDMELSGDICWATFRLSRG
jgi:hypothetical protein